MDPTHQENILQGMICENEDIDIDVTSEFLNDSGQGDESLNQGDDSGEVEAEAWDRGQADEGECDGSDGTLNLANTGEVYICIFIIKMLVSIYTCIY